MPVPPVRLHSSDKRTGSQVHRTALIKGSACYTDLQEDIIMANDALARQAFDLINQVRQQNGLSALQWNDGLKAASDVRAAEAGTKFSHTRPNGQDWYTVNPSLVYGENLGNNYNDANQLVNSWMNSPEHMQNILDPKFKTGSISVENVGGKNFWAQLFGC